MNTPCLFCFRNSLNTMHARFIFEGIIHSIPGNLSNKSFISFSRALVKIQDSYFPTSIFSIPLIHTSKVASKNGGFITTSSGAYLQDGFVHLLLLCFGLSLRLGYPCSFCLASFEFLNPTGCVYKFFLS